MSDVAVIGAGAMGSALVEVFAAAGVDVTVWNRTGTEAEALSGPRVRVARSVAEALTSSPLAIVSVSDHQVARALVGEAGVGLGGRAVASTSPVDLDQAASFDTVVTAAGGHYLDLAIPRSDGQVRTGAGVFLVSGDRAAYEANRELLDRVGTATYVADAPGTAYVGGLAVVLAYLPMAVGLLQGLRICRQHDVPFRVVRAHRPRLLLLPDPAAARPGDREDRPVGRGRGIRLRHGCVGGGARRLPPSDGPRRGHVRRPAAAVRGRVRRRSRRCRLDDHRRGTASRHHPLAPLAERAGLAAGVSCVERRAHRGWRRGRTSNSLLWS
jgi:hypothetical protein